MSLWDGLICHLQFDEGGGASSLDLSGNGANGTIIGSPTWTKLGPAGGLVLNGTSQYVNLPILSLLSPNPYQPCLTIAAWVKTTKASANMIFGAYAPSGFAGYGFCVGATAATGKLQYWSNLAAGWSVASSVAVNDGNLHLCAVSVNRVATVGGALVYFCIDGALDTYFTGQPPGPSSISPCIGATSGGGSNWFSGTMGSFTLWNRALTFSEHAEFYNNGLGWTAPFNIRRMGRPLGSRIIVP